MFGVTEAGAHRCSVKKVFLEISQNSQENALAKGVNFIKKWLWLRCFPVNFVKFLGTPFLTEHSRWLLLGLHVQKVRVGRWDLFLKKNHHYFIFFTKSNGTLKQNIVKFKYNQIITKKVKPSRSH